MDRHQSRDLLLLHGKISSFNGGNRDGTTTKVNVHRGRSAQFKVLEIKRKSNRTTGHGAPCPVHRSPESPEAQLNPSFFTSLGVGTLEWPFEAHPLAGDCWLIAVSTCACYSATGPAAGLDLNLGNACPLPVVVVPPPPPLSLFTLKGSPTLSHS